MIVCFIPTITELAISWKRSLYLLHLMRLLVLLMLAEKVHHAVRAAAIGDLEEVERLFLLGRNETNKLY